MANWRNNKTVYITEGALKADVASHLHPDNCFIGIAGANCSNGIVELFQRMGVKSAFECLDMDKLSKHHVSEAAYRLRRTLNEAGIICTSYEWDFLRNGIDDFFLFGKWLDETA